MELVEGGTLRDRLREGTALTTREADRLMLPIASALDHAHTRGVHHCDIKPANILLPPDGPPMLADFGVARMQGEEGTLAAPEGAGTPEYMAPESLRTGRFDPVSGDIYALGVVFWEALVGKRLFPPTVPPLSGAQRLMRVVDAGRELTPLDPGDRWPPHLRALIRDMTSTPRRVADMATVVSRLRNQDVTVPVDIEPTLDLPSLVALDEDLNRELLRWLLGGATAAILGGAVLAGLTGRWIGAW
jgi:serine/threonine-protein kinase